MIPSTLKKGNDTVMEKLLDYILAKKHHAFREDYNENLSEIYSKAGLTPEERMADRFERLCKAQTPHILPGEQIVI